MSAKIIAEVGECFNGDINTAFTMIKEAKKAGCDIVKFQLLDMDEVAEDDPEYSWFKKLELDREKLALLIKWSKEIGIEILFTPVSVKTASYLIEYGIDTIKIASSFLKKRLFLEFINNHFKKVYMSTGMAELSEIREGIKLLSKPEEVIIMHCISEYPTGPLLEERGLSALDERDAHLNMMTMLKKEFPENKIGYSDHTDGIFVPLIAVAMGAEVIEKHFTLDRQTPINNYLNKKEYMGTDHVLSIEPDDLKTMVKEIRRVEKCQGNMKWERSTGERILLDFLRGRYAKRDR
ncbi:MAG: hypothetical protein HFH79_03895 [Lachnospiraceae bacterium]|nr:hypothetical protein [Lachnospiraceae bacterium]